jgi:hypothetical protein
MREPRRSICHVMWLDQPGVHPLDDGGIAEGLRIVAQVVGHDRQHVKPFVELEAEGLVVDLTVHHLDDVVPRGYLAGVAVVAAQARAAADARKPEPFDELSARLVELAADAMALERRIDERRIACSASRYQLTS